MARWESAANYRGNLFNFNVQHHFHYLRIGPRMQTIPVARIARQIVGATAVRRYLQEDRLNSSGARKSDHRIKEWKNISIHEGGHAHRKICENALVHPCLYG